MKKLLNTFIVFIAMYMAFVLLYGLLASLLPADSIGSLPMLYLLQTSQTILLFGLSAVIAVKINREASPLTALGFQPASLRNLLLAIAIAVCALPFVSVVGDWNSAVSFPCSLQWLENQFREMEDAALRITERMMNTRSYALLILNLIVMAALPALCEELFFRGVVQRYLQLSFDRHVAVWVTAIIFSAIHFQFFGFIPRLLMGAGLGYMFLLSKSLWLPITAHFVNNACTVIAAFYICNTGSAPSFVDAFTTWYMALASITVVIALIYKISIGKNTTCT